MSQKPYGTVLLKAAKIMDFLADQPDSSLQVIAHETVMTSSTTLKILETLVLIGYVDRDKEKNYRLGSKLIRYANHTIEQIDLLEITTPILEALQKKIDETIHLGIPAGNEILYINKLDPKNQTVRMSSKVGITRPLYCSAMGKAVLSEFTREEYENYLAATPLLPFTEHTITNSLKLEKDLATVRESGVAYDDEEVEKDIFCIGTGVKQNEHIVGAFSVSMPKYRLTPEYHELLIKEILIAKKQIEERLAEKK